MATTKTLKLNFKDSQDKASSLTLTGAKEGLTEDDIRPVMETISTSGIFVDKALEPKYAKVDSAEYVTRTVDAVFDDGKDAE